MAPPGTTTGGGLTNRPLSGGIGLYRPLTQEQIRNYVLFTFWSKVLLEETVMLRTFVEEAAALASITLFVGMIAIWAQLFSQL
jgi:hypothetical protein